MNFPTSGVKHNAEKVNAAEQKIADDGGAVLLSGDSSGDLGFSSTTFFTFDAWGSDLPSYGMDMVFVTAEKDLMEFRNYFSTPLTLPEYTAIEGGGGGGGAVGDCAAGTQKVDWGFIEAREGNTTTGYIPKAANGSILGHSGVTIASGFDLGQHSVSDLNTLHLSSDLVTTLTPYMGLKNAAAQTQLNSSPLSITSAQATEINQAVKANALSKLVVNYDNAVGAGAFYSLPQEAQTSIASVSFQYGNLANSAPTFWGKVVAKDWAGAVSELRNFGDSYPTRRGLEADRLQQGIDNAQLHAGKTC